MTDVAVNGPDEAKVWPSIEDTEPEESGGPDARRGFDFQDEVAVGILLEMLDDPNIVRVHCETHDDTVIVRTLETGGFGACFVQAKSSQKDKHLSVADLCHREGGVPGASLYEHSLSKDRHIERASFRIVTARPLTKELEVLTFSLESEFRAAGNDLFDALVAELNHRCESTTSPKGNGATYWVSQCAWDASLDETGLCRRNVIALLRLAEGMGHRITLDHVDLLLTEMRQRVKSASSAKWIPDKAKKLILRVDLLGWLKSRLAEITMGAGAIGGGKLSGKLEEASVADDMIHLAVNLRRRYAEISRTQKYQVSDEQAQLQSRVEAEVMTLRANYAAGFLDCSPSQFHALCLQKMDEINQTRSKHLDDQSAFLKGCMYDIADRCLLRFRA